MPCVFPEHCKKCKISQEGVVCSVTTPAALSMVCDCHTYSSTTSVVGLFALQGVCLLLCFCGMLVKAHTSVSRVCTCHWPVALCIKRTSQVQTGGVSLIVIAAACCTEMCLNP